MNYDRKKLIAQLKRHEGLKLEAYQDSIGVWTVGYGRNLQELTITEVKANEWLSQDMENAADDLNRAAPFVGNLSENRRRVLINMSVNLGISKLMLFKKMWAALKKRDYHKASMEMIDSKWARQVGKRADELAEMMIEG